MAKRQTDQVQQQKARAQTDQMQQQIAQAQQVPQGRLDVDADGNVVLCAASAYQEKYFLNPLFEKLPEEIKKELKIISVLFVEEIGGSFLMEFDDHQKLQFRTEAYASDYNYDEIGAALMCREIRSNRQELLRSLELFYRVFVLGEPLS